MVLIRFFIAAYYAGDDISVQPKRANAVLMLMKGKSGGSGSGGGGAQAAR